MRRMSERCLTFNRCRLLRINFFLSHLSRSRFSWISSFSSFFVFAHLIIFLVLKSRGREPGFELRLLGFFFQFWEKAFFPLLHLSAFAQRIETNRYVILSISKLCTYIVLLHKQHWYGISNHKPNLAWNSVLEANCIHLVGFGVFGAPGDGLKWDLTAPPFGSFSFSFRWKILTARPN